MRIVVGADVPTCSQICSADISRGLVRAVMFGSTLFFFFNRSLEILQWWCSPFPHLIKLVLENIYEIFPHLHEVMYMESFLFFFSL